MHHIEITRVTLKEIQNLQKVSRQTFYETFADQNTTEDMHKYLNQNFSETRLKKELTDPCSVFYFARLGEKVIAYLKLNFGASQTEIKSDNALEIERIYVLKAHQRKGAGQLLYE